MKEGGEEESIVVSEEWERDEGGRGGGEKVRGWRLEDLCPLRLQ